MSNIVETRRITQYVACGLTKEIDEIIKDNGLYTSKSDFCIQAYRFGIEWIISKILEEVDRDPESENYGMWAPNSVLEEIRRCEAIYSEYSGGASRITFVVPEKMIWFVHILCGYIGNGVKHVDLSRFFIIKYIEFGKYLSDAVSTISKPMIKQSSDSVENNIDISNYEKTSVVLNSIVRRFK